MHLDIHKDLGPKRRTSSEEDAFAQVRAQWPGATREGSCGAQRSCWKDSELVAHYWEIRWDARLPRLTSYWLRLKPNPALESMTAVITPRTILAFRGKSPVLVCGSTGEGAFIATAHDGPAGRRWLIAVRALQDLQEVLDGHLPLRDFFLSGNPNPFYCLAQAELPLGREITATAWTRPVPLGCITENGSLMATRIGVSRD